MLEIFILIRTCKRIKELCKERGLSSTSYIILNIVGYFVLVYGGLFGFIFLSDKFNIDNPFMILGGFAAGIGGYVLCNYQIREKIKSYPTTANDEIDLIGKIGN
mgnify:CR=1 FL=1